ncbi:MAG: hypothetical protein PHU95_06715 [Candidatus Thermoplasmatota archaeon]|nr:hypothetical protein [Candidatus Thermoplasmatota archaeon]MDD5779123.1 hypothetical protein [Candidatus Thermoplasmatota archaeon]
MHAEVMETELLPSASPPHRDSGSEQATAAEFISPELLDRMSDLLRLYLRDIYK